jgi:hypothetical protein
VATGDYDPDVYNGDVVAYQKDKAGDAVCMSPYLSSKIGDVRMGVWDLAEIPTGWNEADGSSKDQVAAAFGDVVTLADFTGDGGRFAKHLESPDTIREQGGEKNHGPGADNNHADHDIDDVAAALADHTNVGTSGDAQSGTDIALEHTGAAGTGVSLTHTGTENRPPYTVVYFIQRWK